jgi:uncharacterized membrane protein YqaE (UPF0057 family)
MAKQIILAAIDATPIKLAGIVVFAVTVSLVTGHLQSDAYINVILTILGYTFGHAVGMQTASTAAEATAAEIARSVAEHLAATNVATAKDIRDGT